MADLVHGRLVESGRTVAVAESLTGGLISAFLTTSPGTNVTFRGGLVVYATDLKCTAAGVRPEDLERHGPVHPLIAEQLASGARERLSADYGVGVTGVAGPGAQGGRPVGEVLVAVGSAAGTSVRRHEFDGDRDAVRIAAAAAALGDLVDVLDSAAVETHRDRSRGSD
ncbi:CinA family protein [Frankia sp. EI5c]|uniref:CinA family protein n=1 Tax=Frankia sp. EI5c TaxID=683316 RepID=UPI000825B26A